MPKLITMNTGVNGRFMEMNVFLIIKELYYSDGTKIHKLIGTGFFFQVGTFFKVGALRLTLKMPN
jgi:hypothetical protein